MAEDVDFYRRRKLARQVVIAFGDQQASAPLKCSFIGGMHLSVPILNAPAFLFGQ
jgi:hypothetical protein